MSAFRELSSAEGIIPAFESAHALAYAMRMAREATAEQILLVNLSGRGDKDVIQAAEILSAERETNSETDVGRPGPESSKTGGAS